MKLFTFLIYNNPKDYKILSIQKLFWMFEYWSISWSIEERNYYWYYNTFTDKITHVSISIIIPKNVYKISNIIQYWFILRKKKWKWIVRQTDKFSNRLEQKGERLDTIFAIFSFLFFHAYYYDNYFCTQEFAQKKIIYRGTKNLSKRRKMLKRSVRFPLFLFFHPAD